MELGHLGKEQLKEEENSVTEGLDVLNGIDSPYACMAYEVFARIKREKLRQLHTNANNLSSQEKADQNGILYKILL